MKFCFGDIVVVENNWIGVVVKSWINTKDNSYTYEVYVRMMNGIREYSEDEIQRYMVRHKYLDEQEIEWNNNAVYGM